MRYSVHAQVTNTDDNGDKEMGTDEPSKMMEVRMKMIVVLSTGNLTVKVVIQNQVPQGSSEYQSSSAGQKFLRI